MSIQLAVVTETWLPEINGVAHTTFQLVSGLLSSGGYQINLIRPTQKTELAIIKHPAFKEFKLKGFKLPFYQEVQLGLPHYFALKKRWKLQRPDLIQVVTEGPLGFAAIKAARALNIPVSYTHLTLPTICSV